MWIEREYSARVRTLTAQRPVLVLTGARQTGKSSLLRRLFPDHHYVSLDLPSDAALAEHDPQAFLRQHPPPLIVDEVQYAPGIFRHLKLVVDGARDHRGELLLTGSQRFVLMQAVSESLAGRAAIIELDTLSFAEVRSVAPQRARRPPIPSRAIRRSRSGARAFWPRRSRVPPDPIRCQSDIQVADGTLR